MAQSQLPNLPCAHSALIYFLQMNGYGDNNKMKHMSMTYTVLVPVAVEEV